MGFTSFYPTYRSSDRATPTYAIITPNIPEPTSTEFSNGGVQHPLDTIIPLDFPRSNITSEAQWRNWETWRVTVDQLEDLLKTTPGLSIFDLMPDVRQNIQQDMEATLSPVVTVPDFPPDEDDSDSSVEGEDNGDEPISSSHKGDLDAALTSEPLLAIANGDFSISDTTSDSFGWDTRGASGIENSQAILTEDSPFLSNFTQTFTVPEESKTLQFTLVDTEDDVQLSDQNLSIPIATDDTASTVQGQPVAIAILNNDSDNDGTIAVNSVQIQTDPSHGSAIVRPDGTVSYVPGTGFAGEDTFAYVVQDNDGQLSNPATVTVTVDNAAPTISDLQIPDNIIEGAEIEISAIASDAGNNTITSTGSLLGRWE